MSSIYANGSDLFFFCAVICFVFLVTDYSCTGSFNINKSWVSDLCNYILRKMSLEIQDIHDAEPKLESADSCDPKMGTLYLT